MLKNGLNPLFFRNIFGKGWVTLSSNVHNKSKSKKKNISSNNCKSKTLTKPPIKNSRQKHLLSIFWWKIVQEWFRFEKEKYKKWKKSKVKTSNYKFLVLVIPPFPSHHDASIFLFKFFHSLHFSTQHKTTRVLC